MDIIYTYRGEIKKGKPGEDKIIMAAKQFAKQAGINFDPETDEILRTENGKPYFKSGCMYFSLTHSWDMWMCIFSAEGEVGIDYQFITPIDGERLARRFFPEDEAEYVELNGDEAFFEIWVKKESYAKMTGKGLMSRLQSMLSDVGADENGKYYFTKVNAGDEARCAVCRRHESPINMITLQV